MLPIAREARWFLLIASLGAIYLQSLTFPEPNWLLWIVLAVLFFLFRDFHREVPPIPLAVISPVDGKIVSIEQANDPYAEREALVITIQQSYLGEYNFHSAVEGKIQQLWVRKSKNGDVPALVLWTSTDEDDDAVVFVDLRSKLKRATTSVHPGERIGQGQRCGLVGVGCKVKVYLPANAKPSIEYGQKVVAGEQILAHFVHAN